MTSMRWLWVVVLGLLAGCKPAADAPLRSPSLDYRPPSPTTSDGRVVGVDNKPPEDHIAEGPSNKGFAPGWSFGKGKWPYDQRKRVGGAIDMRERKEGTRGPAPASSATP